MARAAADGDDMPGASAAVGGSGGEDDGRQGWTLTGKGREPVQRQRQVRLNKPPLPKLPGRWWCNGR